METLLTHPTIIDAQQNIKNRINQIRNVNYSLNLAVLWTKEYISVLILGLHPANDRRRYKVTPYLICLVQTQNQPCISKFKILSLK